MFINVDWQNVSQDKFLSITARSFMICALLLGFSSFYYLYEANSRIAKLDAAGIALVKQIESRRSLSSDFSFDVNKLVPGNDVFNIISKYQPKGANFYVARVKTLMAMIYPQYSNGNDLFLCSLNGKNYVPCFIQ